MSNGDEIDYTESEIRSFLPLGWRLARVEPTGRWDPALLCAPGDILGPAAHAGLGTEIGFFLVVSMSITMHFVADARSD